MATPLETLRDLVDGHTWYSITTKAPSGPPLREKIWGVYVRTLEKPGCKFMLYIGSGPDALLGVAAWFKNHGQLVSLHLFVKAALEEGYTITDRGLLYWAPIPAVSLIYSARVAS